MATVITTRRIYDEPLETDGYRVLVDRLWPRGFTKEKAAIDEWAKALAPSNELRQWYHHTPESWPEFQTRYVVELKHNQEAISSFVNQNSKHKKITLLYSAKSSEYNHALVLMQYLQPLFASKSNIR